MCTAVVAAIGLSFAQIVAQRQQARDIENFREDVAELNEDLALRSASDRFRQIRRRTVQERQAVGRELEDIERDALAATSRARLAAAEGGAAGNSVTALIREFTRQELTFRTDLEVSQRFREEGAEDQIDAIQGQTQARILSAFPEPVGKPTFLGSLARLGGAGLQAHSFERSLAAAEARTA